MPRRLCAMSDSSWPGIGSGEFSFELGITEFLVGGGAERKRLVESRHGVPEIAFLLGYVQDERAEAERDVAMKLLANTGVAPDEVGAEGLVVLKRAEPIRMFFRVRNLSERRQLV